MLKVPLFFSDDYILIYFIHLVIVKKIIIIVMKIFMTIITLKIKLFI